MSYNYTHVLSSIDPSSSTSPPPSHIKSPKSPNTPHHRSSSPVLLHPLPTTQALTRESQAQSELELDKQQKQIQKERELAEALQEQAWEIERSKIRNEMGTWGKRKLKDISNGKGRGNDGGKSQSRGFTNPPQAYQLYQAIDKRDIEFIMRVRDHAFGLLLQKNAGEFPIVYASRIGDSHRDVVILLVGALSRYVNQLEDDDFKKKETQNTLKALRSNLKLAIDNALLPAFSPALLSSYLQVLIMSEGDSWLHKAVYDLSLLLRDPSAQPVAAAEAMVRRFCTKELRGVEGGIGGVEEYIANAALDLVIMAIWSLASSAINVDPLPTYTFARDLRTFQLFAEVMEENRLSLGKCNSRLRGMLNTLRELAGDTRKSVRGRLKDVANVLDKRD